MQTLFNTGNLGAKAARAAALCALALAATLLHSREARAQWTTAGTNTTTTNNVGVGTSAPEGTLDVQSGSTTALKVTTTGSATTGRAALQLYRGSAANSFGWDFGYNTDLSSESLTIREFTNGVGTARFSIGKDTGNVGIGTTAPASKLDVLGTSGVTVRTGGASAGFSVFDRPTVPGDQMVFQGNAGNYSVLNTATRNANFGSEKLSGLAMWTVDNAYTPNATQFQLQNSPSYGGVIFTQKFGTGVQGDKKVSFQTAWNQQSVPTQFVLDTTGNVGIGTASPAQTLHVKGKGLFQNTGTASAFIMDRTDGKIASFGAGGASATFAYDDTGVFKIESNTRANINAGAFGGGATTRLMIDGAGNVGVGTDAPAAKLHVTGDIRVDGNISAKYQDVAEWVPSTQKLAVGTVVVLDTGRGNHVLASHRAYDTRVAGVISAQPGLSLGEAGEGKVLVATTGRVRVRVDATRGPVQIGDLIVTSDVPGVAMRSQPVAVGGVEMHRPGTLIGKALESLEKGTGEILVLLSLQ